MKNSKEFTVSANADQKQKNDYQQEQKNNYEREQRKIADRRRVQDIERIHDKSGQQKMLDMLIQRDHDLENKRNADELKIKQSIDEELVRDKLQEPTLTPKPPIGMENFKADQSPRHEDRLRTEIRQRMEQKFEPENKLLEKEANRKIDDTLEKILERQQERVNFQKAEPEKKLESFKDRLRSAYNEAAKDNDLSRNFEREAKPRER